MTDFYHMSTAPLSVGTEIRGNGKDKIDSRIENELEARKPAGMLSRQDAVYARPVPDFSRCGIINAGYIYRVRLTGIPQRHDLNWLGPMQQALLKEKYLSQYPERFEHYPDWTDDLIAKCCSAYWEGAESDSPMWESLAPSFTVVEILSDRPVNVTETRGGWSSSA
jgi:hypothetical protein